MPDGRLWCCGCGEAYVTAGPKDNTCGRGHTLRELERMARE